MGDQSLKKLSLALLNLFRADRKLLGLYWLGGLFVAVLSPLPPLLLARIIDELSADVSSKNLIFLLLILGFCTAAILIGVYN